MKSKRNRNTFFNRLLFTIQCKHIARKMTDFKLREFYWDLLRNQHKSHQPRWKVVIALKVSINEINKRNDKSQLSKKRICSSR